MTATGSSSEPISRGAVARAVAAAVDAVAGARRSPGGGVEIATQYAGGRVIGVHLGDAEVTVHVVLERLPVQVVAEQVRSAAVEALASLHDDRPVTVAVEDLDVEALSEGAEP